MSIIDQVKLRFDIVRLTFMEYYEDHPDLIGGTLGVVLALSLIWLGFGND